MKFENENQIINESAKEIVKNHLNWSNSLDSIPSENGNRFYGDMIDAYIDAIHGEDWDYDGDEYKRISEIVLPMYEKAMEQADNKWNAMMAVMDI